MTLPWDPRKQFSSIVGRTCSDVSRMNDPSTLVEFYLPLQEYLPGHHIPDVSAHACEDIEEIVKTEYIGTVSNQDIVDLAFVLDPTFVDGKTNIVFLGMVNVFICRYVWCAKLKKLQSIDLQSFPVMEMHVSCPNSIKDTFPKHVFDWIGLFQEHCHCVLCRYLERQGNFCQYTEETIFHRMSGSIYVIIFTRMVFR